MALDIKRELAAINAKDYDFYNNLDEADKKSLSAFVLMRYISNPHGGQDIQEYFIETVNEYLNKDHWLLSKDHKGLLWKLYAAAGPGTKCNYTYLAAGKKQKANKIEKLIAEMNPAMKMTDVELLASLMTKEDIKELFDNLGFDKKQRKEYE